MRWKTRLFLVLLGFFNGMAAYAEDWRMFGRDQTRNAVSPEKNPPTFWQAENSEDPKNIKKERNILWKTTVGTGISYFGTYGDPVIVDGNVWIGTNASVNDKRFYALVCLDAKTGKQLNRHLVPFMPSGAERFLHTMASSPLIDKNRMWFFNNRWEVVCLDLAPLQKGQGDPREIWKVDTKKDLGVFRTKSIFDCRLCSVAIHGEWLYVITGNGVNNWHEVKVNADAPSLVCFNKNTGKIVWQDNSPGKDILHSQFASPTIITIGGKTQVVAPQGDGWVRSFDAATGKLIWKFDTNPPEAKWNSNGGGTRNYLPATAVFHDNRIYLGNGQEPEIGAGSAWLYCIDATKTGDVSPHLPDGPGKGKPNANSGMIWKYGGTSKTTKRPIFRRTLSNVAIHDGLLMAVDISGNVHCLDERTGTEYWVHHTNSTIQGSPLIVDGKVYVGDDDGTVWIFHLAKEKKIINRIEMTRWIRASPVYANGVLYVAAGHTLYAIADSEKKAMK
jgi:outer membrane protein assembly factor BamB